MCVAGLNVSKQPCAHRWYNLKRRCDPSNNLANCPEKLKLEGWESRIDECPWCDGDAVHESTHRLFGNPSSTTSSTSSPISPLDVGFSRPRRSDSGGTLSSLSTLSRHNSTASTESDDGQRHKDMNERLHLYVNLDPHELLPSAARNYPTYPQAQSSDNTSSDEPTPLRRTDSVLKKRWRKSVRLSRTMFNV